MRPSSSRRGPKLPTVSEIRGRDPLVVRAAVAIDGPGDIAAFVGPDADICGRAVIEPLMGGSPAAVPTRYAEGSPAELLPLDVNIALISTSLVFPPEAAEAFRAAATTAGDSVNVHVIADSGHFEPVAPGTSEWRVVEAQILEFAGVMAR